MLTFAFVVLIQSFNRCTCMLMHMHMPVFSVIQDHTGEYDLQCWVIQSVKLYLCPNLRLSNYIRYICFQGPVKNIPSMWRRYFQRSIDVYCNCMLVCCSAQRGSRSMKGPSLFLSIVRIYLCICLGKMACINPSSWLFWINTVIFSKSNASIY